MLHDPTGAEGAERSAATPRDGPRPPAFDYPSPAAVLADGRLSRSERLKVLERWVEHIADREIAAVEAPAAAVAPVDEALLRDVSAALTEVEDNAPPAPNIVARVWQALTRHPAAD